MRSFYRRFKRWWTRGFNRAIARIRAMGEHPFRILKRQFGYTKVRYHGLDKNNAQLRTLFALVTRFRSGERYRQGGVVRPSTGKRPAKGSILQNPQFLTVYNEKTGAAI